MDECYREYGVEKGSANFPDIRGAIEEVPSSGSFVMDVWSVVYRSGSPQAR